MCLQNAFYPLVYLNDGKRKVMMKYGIKVIDRNSFEDMLRTSHEFALAKIGYSRYTILNTMFKKEDIERIDKMIQVPCGCCRECLADNSKQWAFRILKETAEGEIAY